jgi:hypothetical protein
VPIRCWAPDAFTQYQSGGIRSVLSSVTTSTWPALSPGTLSQHAYVYNFAAETVLVEADVNFDTNGVLTSGITHVAGTAGITLANSGTYKVTFSLSDTEPNQMALFVNGALVLGTIYGSEERRLIRTPLSPSRNSTRSRTRRPQSFHERQRGTACCALALRTTCERPGWWSARARLRRAKQS